MIPDVDPDSIEPAERSTYIALRDGLPKRYTVFHSYPWLRVSRGDRDQPLREGEADFVILHPERGLLVLEVKGGAVFHEGASWYRKARGGPKSIRNPFEQAKRNMHKLCDIVEDYSNGALQRGEFIYGYAVVFPHFDHTGRPPPYADRANIICARHLPNIADSVGDAYRAWTGDTPRPLDDRKYAELLKSLTPEFKFIRPIGPDLEDAAQRLMMLTESQAEAHRSLLSGATRALVEGPAGSGKTELALRSAATSARRGACTLFLCYNTHLAGWLLERATLDPSTEDLVRDGALEVWSFHALAADLAKRAGVAWRSSRGPIDDKFWLEEAPEILGQAVNVLEGQGQRARFEAIVVDEAQDFREMWWYSITEELLDSDSASSLHVFLDPNQCLWGEVRRPEIGLPPALKLETNCRNTKRVAGFSAKLLDLQAMTFRFAPEGVPATVTPARNHEDQRRLVQKRVQQLLTNSKLSPDQLVLIGPAAKERGSLAYVESIAGVRLTPSAAEWRRGGGVLVTTARKFKGLEAGAVVIYDVGAFGTLFTPADLYVASTRATYLLEIIVHDNAMESVLRAAAGD